VAALPLIDISPLLDPGADHRPTARQIDDACRRFGFFRITGHGIPGEQLARLERLAREFFALPDDVKSEIAMVHGGAAWRGWFPLDGELTSGRPDHKEGIYFGAELGPDHPAVRAGRPLHGANLFPATPVGLGPAVLAWIDTMTALGTVLLRAVALGLALPPDWFERHVTDEPTVLFRIFRYPPGHDDGWGVAEHTDYGLLTILATDGHDGLQVHAPSGWIDVPSDPEVFVVNLGDMLDRMTEGRYRSTPHRVVNRTAGTRLSFPCFIDPSWDAVCPPMPLDGSPPPDDAARRWDGASLRGWDGTYGEYLTAKVAKVFPDLVTWGERRSGAEAASTGGERRRRVRRASPIRSADAG
jgi:isopenicillin N synthase-like dioxygenase